MLPSAVNLKAKRLTKDILAQSKTLGAIVMGESKRRREKIPIMGKVLAKKEDNSYTNGIFYVKDIDDEHCLIIHTLLARKGFGLPKGVSVDEIFWNSQLEATFKSLITGEPQGCSFCYVEKHPDLRIGDYLVGKLEEDPKLASLQGRFTRFTSFQILDRESDERSVNVDPQPESSKISFVLASELSNVRIYGEFHVWQVLDGAVKSFTNSLSLANFEKSVNFDIGSFFRLMVKKQGGEIPKDGFYWVNHYKKTASYFPCTTWTKKCENALIERGVIELVNKNQQ